MRFRASQLRTVLCIFLLSTPILYAAEDSTSPNIIVVFCDDQGYQDLGCFGSPNIKTPCVDRMAAEGMRFTDFYSGYCVCSASRASLLTGCYQPRINMPGVLGPRSNVGLHPNEVTIADLLDDPTAESPHDEIGYYFYKNGKPEAVRLGKWKLHLKKQVELYDLRADIGETNNVAGTNSDVVAKLRDTVAQYDADLKANSRPIWRGDGRKR